MKVISGHYVNTYSIVSSTNGSVITTNRNAFATKKLAKASIAMAQLSQLREVYRQGWEPNWEDKSEKYVIYFYDNKIDKTSFQWTCKFLSFQTPEIRDEFLNNFRDLIETAKPLMS